MRIRPLGALFALCLLVLTSGCCHECWCSRHPYAPRCRPACCPQAECGCCNSCAYPGVQPMAPPPGLPVVPQ